MLLRFAFHTTKHHCCSTSWTTFFRSKKFCHVLDRDVFITHCNTSSHCLLADNGIVISEATTNVIPCLRSGAFHLRKVAQCCHFCIGVLVFQDLGHVPSQRLCIFS